MKKLVFLFAAILVLSSCKTATEAQDKKDILAIMDAQQIAWSKHDLEGFMQGYWKSDSLKFYGSNGVTLGWDKTLANYKKGYATPNHSGILKFKINDITKIEKESYYVMGAYHLTRKIGDASGVFMIIFRKIKGEWKIVADTSC
jgi:hypothetical protein